MNRRFLEFGVIPLLVTVVGGLAIFFFSSPGQFTDRVTEIITWFGIPVTMPLWQLISILLVTVLLSTGYVRLQRFKRSGRVKVDGVEWVKRDNVTPSPLCPKCGKHAFIAEASGQLRCSIKCSHCNHVHPSVYGKVEILNKVEEQFTQKAADLHLPPGGKK
jgi:ribosomal protein S27AE